MHVAMGASFQGGSTSTAVLAPRKTKGGTSQDASEHLASSDTEVVQPQKNHYRHAYGYGNIHFFELGDECIIGLK